MNLVSRGHFSYWNEKVLEIGLNCILASKPIEIIMMSGIWTFVVISKTFTMI